MHGRDEDSPGTEESGYGYYPSSQPSQLWGSSPSPPPFQAWSPTSPPWQQSQYRAQSSHQRNLGRSAFGDYRPTMDSPNHPRPDTPSHSFQRTQTPLSDFDRFTIEQMMGMMSPGLPETPPTRSGGGGGGGRGGGNGGGGRGGGNGGGGRGGDNGGDGGRGGGAGGVGDEDEADVSDSATE
ncbi:glycine-rich RNA-binding protein 1-like [Salvia hispanica]|uniref:glycine-rich RNA-binding protein 1-like n=1 Tax=Salvia hispanica TaxID=49212 RepID=UPI002009C833|nr:glycine-rich RNA-binding protein 1-like [Salvia hispanica]